MQAKNTHCFRPTPVPNIPRERRQLHGEHHLGASYLERLVAQVEDGADEMAARRSAFRELQGLLRVGDSLYRQMAHYHATVHVSEE